MTGEAGARSRILEAARDLFQRKGFHGAGLAEILTRADAPKGSLYHHFPGGKDELAAAAVGAIAAEVETYIATRAEAGKTGVEIVAALARMCATRMAAEGFTWSPLLSVLGGATGPEAPLLGAALQGAYAGWEQRLADVFRAGGLTAPEAGSAAQLALLALEGAIGLARATRTTAPLDQAGPLLARFVAACC